MNEYVVLVVDDEQEIRNGIAIYLKNEGIKVFTAKDGIEAIEILNKEKVHLIILDIMMPRQDGISTTFKIREQKNIPIIMLTALDDSTDRIRGLDLGADDYLVKPFGFQELHAHVKAMLRRVQLTTQPMTPRLIRSGDIEVNVQTHEVRRLEYFCGARVGLHILDKIVYDAADAFAAVEGLEHV